MFGLLSLEIPTCKKEMFALVRAIWAQEHVPPDMVTGTFVMLFKNKGSKNDCTKYRMICLLPTAYKMVSTLLLHRLIEPAPLDWPMSQPNLLNLDIAHHIAMTHP